MQIFSLKIEYKSHFYLNRLVYPDLFRQRAYLYSYNIYDYNRRNSNMEKVIKLNKAKKLNVKRIKIK